MKKINSSIAKSLISGILTILIFVGSIVGIVLGALFQLWVLMGICIAVVVIMLFLLWIPWARLAVYRDLKKTVAQVEKGVLNTTEIAEARHCREVDVRKDIADCLNRGFIVGYHLEGDDLVKGDKVIKQKNISVTCPNCHTKTMVPGVKCLVCSKCGYTQKVGE